MVLMECGSRELHAIQVLFCPCKANSSLAAVQRFSHKLELPYAIETAEEMPVNNMSLFKLKFK